MRISPSFNSQHSFEELDSSDRYSVGGTDSDALGMDWGVVSTTESDVGNYEQRSSGTGEYIGDGILILSGVDSGRSTNNEHSTDLSVPGTDSLPSEIDSVSEEHIEEPMSNVPQSVWRTKEFSVFVVGAGLAVLLSLVAGLVLQQHNHYRSTMLQLEEKIKLLEKEKELLTQPPWMDEDDHSHDSSLFTLLDNCWIKAKMNVKFGDCSKNSHGLCGAFFENATQSIWKWFDESFPATNAKETTTRDNVGERPSLNDIMETLTNFPVIVGEAIVSASKAVSEQFSALNLGTDEEENPTDDLIRASEAFSEALSTAGGTLVSELNELGADPFKYLADAVDQTLEPTKSAKVSLDGLRNVAEAVASTSIGWGQSLLQIGEAISAKVGAFITDPSLQTEVTTKPTNEEDL